MVWHTDLEILRDIQNPSDVQVALIIEVAERVGEVRRLDLPDTHEDELVVGMSCEEHRKESLRILSTNAIPWDILKKSQLLEIFLKLTILTGT